MVKTKTVLCASYFVFLILFIAWGLFNPRMVAKRAEMLSAEQDMRTQEEVRVETRREQKGEEATSIIETSDYDGLFYDDPTLDMWTLYNMMRGDAALPIPNIGD